MHSAGICFNHQPPLHRRREGGRNGFRMAGWLAPPAPSNRASGPVRAGKPSRPNSRSLFVFVGQLSICHRHRRSRSWCCSCSTALADEQLLPRLLKLSPCSFSTMVGPDNLAASVPHFLDDAEVLPNTFGLPVAVEERKLVYTYVIRCY